MIELAWKSTLIFALAGIAVRGLEGASAAQRHAVWMLAFVAVPLSLLISRAGFSAVPAVSFSVLAGAGPGQGASGASFNWVLALWIAGAAVVLMRLAWSYWSLWRSQDAVETPMVFGILRPRVLVPRSAIAWAPELENSVLLHERAHILRYDCIAQLFTQLSCAVMWFQPLAWYAAKQAAAEREQACDDCVLANGVAPADYAGHLLEVACTSVPQAAIGIARQSSLETRLLAITDDSRSRRVITSRWRIGLALSCLAMLAVVPGLQAQADNHVYKVGEDGTVAPSLLQKVEPAYTDEDKANQIEGTVLLQLEITKDGFARAIKVTKSLSPGLDRSAITAVEHWRFRPATRQGIPVLCRANIEVNFRLQ